MLITFLERTSARSRNWLVSAPRQTTQKTIPVAGRRQVSQTEMKYFQHLSDSTILARLTIGGTVGKVAEGVVELETFSDPGSVLVLPHFCGQHRPLVELVTLFNIHIDPVERL